jgi:lipase chaperone LimK
MSDPLITLNANELMRMEEKHFVYIDKLQAHIEDLERQRAVWQEHFDHMAMQIAEARNAALEEAAAIADTYSGVNSDHIANRIRAIKDKPHG